MSSATAPLQILLDLINSSVAALICSASGVQCFVGRWQLLRGKLGELAAALAETAESPHWAENPLLHTLLPTLLSTLSRLSALSSRCSDASFSGGKLLLQSDLDIAASALSHHSAKDDLSFFLRDLFTRLQIGGDDFKRKSLHSLLQLLADDAKSAIVVARECNLAYLVHLLDHHSLRDLAALAVSAIVASGHDSASRIIFEEGALGPLLRIVESAPAAIREKAAAAVEAITADPENAWAVSAYGGVSILLDACRSGSAAAVGAIRNVANVEDARVALAEEGAVPVLLQILVSGAGSDAQEKAAGCVAVFATSGEHFRSLIIQERGLQRLIHLVTHDGASSPAALEQFLRAIAALSSSDQAARALAGSTAFVVRLGELVKRGNPVIQQLAASMIGALPISDGNKRAIGSSMASLMRLTEFPKPAGMQETAARALVSLLSVRSNRKELVRDEKSVTRLAQMLDPRMESAAGKSIPVAVLTAVLGGGSSQGCRRRLVAAGVQQHLQRLAEMDVPGAKKAAQRLSGNRLKTIFTRTWRE